MTETSVRAGGGAWVLLPQAVSRLSAVYVFAVAARSISEDQLGALVIATALTSGSVALAPAIVGKPLAVLTEDAERRTMAPQAQSFAVLGALAVGLCLGVVGLAAAPGPLRQVLLASAIGIPAAMAVESHYWRAVFLHGRRRAGLALSGAYLAQGVGVTVGALVLPDPAVVLSPFLGLAGAALVALVSDGLSPAGGRAWATRHRARWLPYVFGVAAAVALAQAVPVILALTAGLAAASAYRAGELVFGVTNLLIGVVVQTQLTGEAPDPLRTYRRASAVLVCAALLNGAVLVVLPTEVLAWVVGPTADRLREVVLPFTGLRAALAVASVGAVLMLRHLPARRAGGLGVLSAVLGCVMLVVGALLGGLVGGVTGLAAAEVVIATYYSFVLRRSVAAPAGALP